MFGVLLDVVLLVKGTFGQEYFWIRAFLVNCGPHRSVVYPLSSRQSAATWDFPAGF